MYINTVYTRRGDKGQTTLADGARVAKDNLRVEAYGTVDELQSLLGLLCSLNAEAEALLEPIEQSLFIVGSSLSGVSYTEERLSHELDTVLLEQTIDRLQQDLPPLRAFILPGGTVAASVAHLARTVCRRAERRIVSLAGQEKVMPQLLPYMNRLSDLLFVLARHLNYVDNRLEKKWENTCK